MAFDPGMVHWAENINGEVGLLFLKPHSLKDNWPTKSKAPKVRRPFGKLAGHQISLSCLQIST